MASGAQLTLFDTAAVIDTTYKVGDFVKLRRKSAHAAGFKKGDIIQIQAIHPRDGSCKFWSDRTESWGYVYPDDFTLVPPPKIDSITPLDVAVIESTPLEVAVIESTAPPAAIDSITLNPISIYKPGGTARSGEYFRFSYRDGGKVRHIHIRGGNTDSPIAIAKVQEVRSLLVAGVSPVQIVATLAQFNQCEKQVSERSCQGQEH